MTRVGTIESDEFFCRCRPTEDGDDSNIKRCDEVRETAAYLLERGEADLYEKLLYLLAIESYSGVKIFADQWAAVCVSYRGTTGRDEEVSTYFQCDDILDGLCAAYLWLLTQRLFEELERE